MSKTNSSGPHDAPETIWQAGTFDSIKRRYVRLGLCSACAAQAAWGHQLGFSRSNPPCQECQPLVDTFPVKKPNRWHSWSPRRGASLSQGLRPGIGQDQP